MNRRNLLRATALAVPVFTLGACAATATEVITVTLEVAQAESSAIWTAFQAYLAANGVTLPAVATTAYNLAQDAISAFIGLAANATSFSSEAKAVIADVQALLGNSTVASLLPATTISDIKTGLTILSALIAGEASITVSTVPSASVGAARVVAAPYPIRLGG